MVTEMTESISNENLLLLAEARASFSGFLSLHFLNLPDKAFVEQIRTENFRSVLKKLILDENIHPEISQGAKLMNDFLEENDKFDDEGLSETLGIDRTRLYRGVSPTYGPPPPYEAVWATGTEQQNTFLQQIADIYHRAGLAQAQDIRERVDYIGIELAYIENLARDEAKHLKAGKREAAGALLERQKSFWEEHLIRWVPQFVTRALEYAKTDFYRGHLFMLRGFILEQAEILSTITSDPME